MASEPTPQQQNPSPTTLDFYLHQALTTFSPVHTSDPCTLFSLPSSPSPSAIPLNPTGPNTLLLYPGSFNPPHAGHLTTILYFYEHRRDFGIRCLFVFADPEMVVGKRREKKYNVFLMGQEVRYKLFAHHPSLTPLLATGFLKLLTGSMTSHIAFLRHLTDLIKSSSSLSSPSIPATLTGFLGGDKLSIHSSPHQKPGELIEWGPVDEFLIMNARRPVDFYNPWEAGLEKEEKAQDPNPISVEELNIDIAINNHSPSSENPPSNLPNCTPWQRGPLDSESINKERRIGQLWSCKALTVPGEPVIWFRGSERSASNGISSTGIRRIMCEVWDRDVLLEELSGLVVCPEILVEWVVGERGRLGMGIGGGEVVEKGEEGEGGGQIEGEKAVL
ncbi:hypothetical protein ONS95_013680 [Cadophora gregata]|uniref:uncharacterized protein n=1 Tax=Cadophora gregata TaxID=51156 RepID=UPI0026DC116B|nr:uncharacterized protein ONS95_013680 [Cadophora gregata]KAK0113423.1 hypothetical protein ONS96_014289 [Cadophora gregata f. sp. sojae]KAK0114180.1 hypothetical protein ONS95_013680 [Cadophora gregata]